MISIARAVFPYRILSFCSLYIVANVILLTRSNFVQNWFQSNSGNTTFSPYLPESVKNRFLTTIKAVTDGTPMISSEISNVYYWGYVSNVFLAFLFICIIAGLSTTRPHILFILGVHHFIGTCILCYATLESKSISYVHFGLIIGVFMPSILEIWNVIAIFFMKVDFY